MRHDGRAVDALREISIERGFTRPSPGSVLIRSGKTTVLCTASIAKDLPPWMKPEAGRGWITAEYNMMPGSTSPRKRRERSGKLDGRTSEIQRLIGRSLRAAVDMEALGPQMITVDCDVLEADGGTRTASITGGFVALVDAIASLPEDQKPKTNPFRHSIAAVSCGIIEGRALLDLDYPEDYAAEVDLNVVMTGKGQFVEIQGTGEEDVFSEEQLQAMLSLAKVGTLKLTEIQKESLGELWPGK
ncbi:Ribonuclease PH [Planctomycetales bacterium 10988]|nr:Ribonuclease PH [Planctomycetales bacterium 10988]